MSDPNDTYKAKFAELAELLGRTPLTTDAGWLQLQEEYKRAWLPAEETVKAEKVSAAGPISNGFSRQPAPQASGIQAIERAREPGEATGGPEIIAEGERAESVPSWGTGALRDCDRPIRGAGGGVLAVCEGCGQEWEREKRRGRPARLCGECR